MNNDKDKLKKDIEAARINWPNGKPKKVGEFRELPTSHEAIAAKQIFSIQAIVDVVKQATDSYNAKLPSQLTDKELHKEIQRRGFSYTENAEAYIYFKDKRPKL